MARTSLSLPFNGDKLRSLREKAGFNVQEFAATVTKSGHRVHRTAIGKIENGVYKPTPSLLAAIVATLNVTVEDLLDEDEKVVTVEDAADKVPA